MCEFFPQMAKAVKPYVKELSMRPPHTLPESAGLRPPVFVSGWSLHPSWQFQCNRPHEGHRNKAGAYQQEWFHYRTIGQSLRRVRLSSTVWHRPSPYCGTMLVDREETVRSDKWIGIWWKSDSETYKIVHLPTYCLNNAVFGAVSMSKNKREIKLLLQLNDLKCFI